MTHFIVSEYLILIFLLPVVIRFVVRKASEKDIFSIFAPVAVIISLLQIVAFGLSLSTMLLFFLTILVLLTNIRLLLRFRNDLYIDWFSLGYRLFSIIEFILILFLGVCVFIFRPTATPAPHLVKEIHYSGNAIRGYSEKPTSLDNSESINLSKALELHTSLKKATFFDKTTLVLYRYSPETQSKGQDSVNPTMIKPILIYLQDPRTTVKDNAFTLASLTTRGFTVYAADVQNSYFSGSKHFLLRLVSYIAPNYFTKKNTSFIEVQAEAIRFIIQQATSEAEKQTPDGYAVPKLFIVADGLAKSVAQKSLELFPDKLGGSYLINFTEEDENNIPSFSSTPAYFDGYGNIPLLYPEEVTLFAGKRNKAALGVPSLIAAEVDAAVNRYHD